MIFAMESELWEGDVAALSAESCISTTRTLLQPDTGFWALTAVNPAGEIAGVLTLNQCAAIYAGRTFGEIMEIYIPPEHRSSGIGTQLIEAARAFGREQGWPFLEVGAPAQPKWHRTLDFYHRQGFRDIGPRLELEL